eukprot:scaffold83365_cov19-Tisochrysis_lutea.AAC.1
MSLRLPMRAVSIYVFECSANLRRYQKCKRMKAVTPMTVHRLLKRGQACDGQTVKSHTDGLILVKQLRVCFGLRAREMWAQSRGSFDQ